MGNVMEGVWLEGGGTEARALVLFVGYEVQGSLVKARS